MKSTKPAHPARANPGLVALALALFLGAIGTAQAVTVTRTNNTDADVDGTFAVRTVSFGGGAFPAGATIDEVKITVDFEKISAVGAGGCPNHDGGRAFGIEIYMGLVSPKGTQVVLVDDDEDTGGSGRGPSYFLDYGGPVSVDFMEGDGLRTVAGVPESGAFEPEEPMDAFWGESPVGTWTLELSDNFPEDPLCFDSYRLAVSASAGFEIGLDMSSSFFDPDYNGSGINTEILAMPTAAKAGEKGSPGVVLVYWYTFDIFGTPIFAFGVGEFVGDTMTVDFFMDYDLTGPSFGPNWNPNQFAGTPFASAEIVWANCGRGIMTFTMAPPYVAGWVPFVMDLRRITNVVGLPVC